MKEINGLGDNCGEKKLLELEGKIVNTILPVKTRLHERWQLQLQKQSSTSSNKKPAVVPASSKPPRQPSVKASPKTEKRLPDAIRPTPSPAAPTPSSASTATARSSARYIDAADPRLVPIGSLSISDYCPEAYHPMALKPMEPSRPQYFVVDDDQISSGQTNDQICSPPSGIDMISMASSNSSSSPQKRCFSDVNMENSLASDTMDTDTNSDIVRRRRKLNKIVPYPRKPRPALYACSLCGMAYQCQVSENPWWAVYKHDCPHCKQAQVPRIDISVGPNAIELDPNVTALYGEGADINSDSDDEDDDSASLSTRFTCEASRNHGSSSNLVTTNTTYNSSLNSEDAAKLLVLMCHARTCTGSHSSPIHADICKSTKFLMLHVRDCTGLDSSGAVCLFPWCHQCKTVLNHVTHCAEPDLCTLCNPW